MNNKLNSRFVRIEKEFLPKAQSRSLRAEFDKVYEDPRRTPQKRFMWDHWHLENQYRLHRTLARNFFSKAAYQKLEDVLVRFGQEHLGCHTISEPWLSYYTEGDEQHFHSDSPHGPWAYVFSLTNWSERLFQGGETLIFREETLNYWSTFSRSRGKEMNDLFQTVPAEFNQLLVFDPRIPHGVRRVSGVHDPRQARLVVHGWFVNPEPFIVGSLKMSKDVVESINTGLSRLSNVASLDQNLRGALVYRLTVSKSGQIGRIQNLTNTLICTDQLLKPLLRDIEFQLKKMILPKARGASQLTLPILFD